MDKRLRKERHISSSESHGEETIVEKASQNTAKSEGRKEKSRYESRGKQQQRRNSDGLGPKHSRVRELLNSFQDDVVQVQESDRTSEVITADIIPVNGSEQVEFSRQFTRMSPNKLKVKHSKWKKAVRLSKSVMSMNRSRQAGTSADAKDLDKVRQGEPSRGPGRKRMMGFLRFLDHGSCISSGILVGLLLWSTMNIASWKDKSAEFIYHENYIRIYSTTTVIFTYVTLVGFLIRIYSSWTRMNSLLVLYVFASLCVLIFHYLTKGYCLLHVECQDYNKLDEEAKSTVSMSYKCAPSQENDRGLSQEELIFHLISSSVQTLGAFIIALYFHFSSFVEPWLTPGCKIESRRIMRS